MQTTGSVLWHDTIIDRVTHNGGPCAQGVEELEWPVLTRGEYDYTIA
jgi:hypothetical protein